MARVIRPASFGGPEVLELVEVPIPSPGPGEVIVQMKAAGVNPIDWKLYSGSFHAIDDKHKDKAGLNDYALPRIGFECAGVVTAVGDGVTGFAVGAEVIANPVTGAYADYVITTPASLVTKPASLSWSQAGGLMLAGTTAAHTLDAASVKDGDRVLVHGGSGGVGLIAIQLAVALGASVIATAAQPNHDLLRSLGATAVTYGPGLLERVRIHAPGGVDAALDLVGTDEALDTSLALVTEPARIASIAGGPRRAGEGVHVIGNQPGAHVGTAVRAAARPVLAEKAGSGDLRVMVAGTYSLAEAADAHRAGINGHQPGKLILVP